MEESWNSSPLVDDRSSTKVYHVQQRIRAGERSELIVSEIVELVRPRIKVEPFSDLHLSYRKVPKQPKKVEDLFSTALTSGKVIDPDVLKIEQINDLSFLVSLILALDSAVFNGLDIAERIEWDIERHLWQLHRVYYVRAHERAGVHEPDDFHRGIAPAVKLLHTVVARLIAVDISRAAGIVSQWKFTNSPIYIRLWAALSRDPRITAASEVGAMLLSLDDRRFWNLNSYPEIAELRAKRFSEFSTHEKAQLITRIRKGPPRSNWPGKADPIRVRKARLYRAIMELRRIEVAGGTLPQRDKIWMNARITEFSELVQMNRLDEGFIDGPEVRWVSPKPDSRFDLLSGEERLKALENNLSSSRGGGVDDLGTRAASWINNPGNATQVLADLESLNDGGAAFPRVLERFGWAHSPVKEQNETAQRDLNAEAVGVLSLIIKLPEATIRQAVNGISHWFSAWEKEVSLQEGSTAWLKLWPIALESTNVEQDPDEGVYINTIAQSNDTAREVDTLNNPVGKLVGFFLAACPSLKENKSPFDSHDNLRIMRDKIVNATGRSQLIARLRLIEWLPYFLQADEEWTQRNLIKPLLDDDESSLALWRAVARRTRFADILKIIGTPMAERATDSRLDRETRKSLTFSLVVECLYAFYEKREPVIPFARIQQMIRLLDDETRAYAAEAINHFVQEISAPNEDRTSPMPEELFRSAASPFLHKVWPQERSLTTPGVSQALANLPAIAQGAFAEAEQVVERFLVPFECWSMIDYGLYGEEDRDPNVSIIDNYEKAEALLRLLDLTIGTSEGAVIPHDLADALEQVRKVASSLAENRKFRRLATLARRS